MEKRYVRINGELICVTEEVYKAYYSHRRRELTQSERDVRNRLVHYDAWDTEKGTGADAVMSGDPGPEDIVIARFSVEKLEHCLKKLNKKERELVHALFYCEETLAALARRLGVPRKTLEGRRDKILRKLRIYFEAPDR